MENGAFLGEDHFERLLEETRLGKRRFYRKITDIHATAIDHNKDAPTTRDFFAKVRNKLHFATHGRTAAEIVMKRADAFKDHMGSTSREEAPDGKVLKSDVSVAKNYLTREELESLGRLVNAFLDLAEDRARRKISMTMEDWAKRIDRFLEFDDREVLRDKGKISPKMARDFAESEFEKCRVAQDRFCLKTISTG